MGYGSVGYIQQASVLKCTRNRPLHPTVVGSAAAAAADIHRPQADGDGIAMVSEQTGIHWGVTAFFVVFSIVLIGLVDYYTGTEIRVYPLYFLPSSLAGWRFGWLGGITSALGATLAWVISNRAVGMHYSHDYIWILNVLAQFVAFGTVAGLLAWARYLLKREQATSRTDTTTGLPNVRAFYESVAHSALLSAGRVGDIA